MSQQELDNIPNAAHVQMKAETALAMTDRDLIEWFGEPLSEVKAELNAMKESGSFPFFIPKVVTMKIPLLANV